MELTDQKTIHELLTRHGFRFSKAKGQNFLIAGWVPERIAAACGAGAGAAVLEVGPGIGCLTAKLAETAGKVVSVELDRSLKPMLDETMAGFANVEIVYADALRTDLCKLMSERAPTMRYCVCANLPYNVTSPLLSQFIDARCFDSITVMVQREVAHRICAAPGTPDYGAFSVYVNWNCEPEILFDVPPDCFMPRPKVTSSVIRLTPRAEPLCAVKDEKLMNRVVRAAFGQRRKTLQNALSNGMPEISRDRAAAAIAACGFDGLVRGETLSVSDFARLSDELA